MACFQLVTNAWLRPAFQFHGCCRRADRGDVTNLSHSGRREGSGNAQAKTSTIGSIYLFCL